MLSLNAERVLIVEGVLDDPAMKARFERMSEFITSEDVREVDDGELAETTEGDLEGRRRHGMNAEDDHIVIFNRFRFDDSEDERKRRSEAFPFLNRHKLNGYGGFDWRDSGSGEFRRKTGLVCQPAWQLHSIVGCHFRCAYCHLGWFVNIMMNVEDFVSRLDNWLERCPSQTLFQYDNYTDTVCFEPEYGGAGLLIDYFAQQPDKALELYVGKSDHVDFLLDYDHRGHTVGCWSLSGRTQSNHFEKRTASMVERIESMRKCQQAGYPVRVRLSPILPVKGWQEENREMIELLFREVTPDLITFETIRFLDYAEMRECFDTSLLDDEFLQTMKEAEGKQHSQGCQAPDEYRAMVYDFTISELERVSPDTPYAFCREKLTLWERFSPSFDGHLQCPDDYLCNCGPRSAPATIEVARHPSLLKH